jgi:hypothetical protein
MIVPAQDSWPSALSPAKAASALDHLNIGTTDGQRFPPLTVVLNWTTQLRL